MVFEVCHRMLAAETDQQTSRLDKQPWQPTGIQRLLTLA